MDSNAYAHQIEALKTRVRQQATALAESEALAIENMEYVAELEQQLAQLQEQTSQQEIGTDELERVRAELVACQTNVATNELLQTELEDIRHIRTHLETELEAAHQCCQQLEAVSSQQAKELEERLAALESDRDRLARQSQEAQEAKDVVANQLAAARRQIKNLQDRLDKAATATADNPSAEQLQEAQRRREIAEANHYVLERQYKALQTRVAELETECAEAHSSGGDRERELSELSNAHADLKVQLEQLQAQNQQLQASLGEIDNSNDSPPEIETSLRQLQQQNEALTASLTDRETQLQAAANATAGATAECDRLQAQIAALIQQNRDLTAALESNIANSAAVEASSNPSFAEPSPTSGVSIAASGNSLPFADTPHRQFSLPSIPPFVPDRDGAAPPSIRNLDLRVRTLAASSAEMVPARRSSSPKAEAAPASSPRRTVDLPAFVRHR